MPCSRCAAKPHRLVQALRISREVETVLIALLALTEEHGVQSIQAVLAYTRKGPDNYATKATHILFSVWSNTYIQTDTLQAIVLVFFLLFLFSLLPYSSLTNGGFPLRRSYCISTHQCYTIPYLRCAFFTAVLMLTCGLSCRQQVWVLVRLFSLIH